MINFFKKTSEEVFDKKLTTISVQLILFMSFALVLFVSFVYFVDSVSNQFAAGARDLLKCPHF